MVEEGTGVEVSKAVLGIVEEWGLKDRIVGLCYDTCSVNTGREAGRTRAIEFFFLEYPQYQGVDSVLNQTLSNHPIASSHARRECFAGAGDGWVGVVTFSLLAPHIGARAWRGHSRALADERTVRRHFYAFSE